MIKEDIDRMIKEYVKAKGYEPRIVWLSENNEKYKEEFEKVGIKVVIVRE